MRDFDKKVQEAEKRVKDMDEYEGFQERSIGTIITALDAGLKIPESGAQFDALVMLKDLRERLEIRLGPEANLFDGLFRPWEKTPKHTTSTYFPDGRVKHFVTEPTGKFDGTFYCKYCYQTHSNWWQMKHEDYDADVLLCGECEHTSLKEILESWEEEVD